MARTPAESFTEAGSGPASVLTPETCWRKARAERVAFLVDSAAYFAAALSAIRKARRSILLLGWSFDPRTRLQPGPHEVAGAADEIGNVLKSLARRRTDLDVRVLVWKSALPISASQHFFPHRSKAWFRGTPVRFRLDASVPYGACHHQKVLVIDDLVAFVGGADFAPDRWDTPAHLDDEPRRVMPGGAGCARSATPWLRRPTTSPTIPGRSGCRPTWSRWTSASPAPCPPGVARPR